MTQLTDTRIGQRGFTRAPQDPRPPAALVVGLAFTAELGWMAATLTVDAPAWAETVGIVAIALVASWWLTVPAAVWLALISFLTVDGFAQNQLGQLSWDGNQDAALVLVLLVACTVTAEIRSGVVEQTRRRQLRQR
jgi:hypothetical protein